MGHQGFGDRPRAASWAQLVQEIFQACGIMLSKESWGKKEAGDVQWPQYSSMTHEVPWDGQTLPIHGTDSLLCLHVWLLFSLLNCLYPKPGAPSVSLLPLSPHPRARGAEVAPWGSVTSPGRWLKAFPSISTTDCNEKFLAATPWFSCLCHLITCHDHISMETSTLTIPKQKFEASKQKWF